MSCMFHGSSQSWMADTFDGSMLRPAGNRMNTRYSTVSVWNLHLLGFMYRPAVLSWCSISLMCSLCDSTSGNDVWSSLRLRELRKLLEAQGAMRASRAYREVIVSARARCH